MTERAPDAAPRELPPPELVLVRYGEIALKRGNRREFVGALARNIEAAARPIAPVRVRRELGRLVVFSERRAEEVAHRLRDVFGIKSVSPAWAVASDPDAITSIARLVTLDALAAVPPGERRTFRVRARRGDKRFPMTSTELERHVADRVLGEVLDKVVVRLKEADVTLGIDVRGERSFVFAESLSGPGGLPVGTLGRVLCLLSGGIDSPVAAWMAMKRGCRVSFATFHAWPYIGESARRKVLDLARVLARFQGGSRVFVVPFADIQVAVRDRTPEAYRTVLYRRFMQRISGRIARAHGLSALVTGESLGQVASQTLENIRCIEAASDATVLRPLIGFDKEETIAIARRIGTYELSSRPEPDCCTVFLPAHPVIRGKPELCERAEQELDVEALVERAAAAAEIVDLEA